jgi:hypothetical protein
MPAGNVRLRSHADMAVGKTTAQTLGALALRAGVKAGLGKNVKAAEKERNTADQRYALAMQDLKSGGRKSGKTAAVAMKRPKREVQAAAGKSRKPKG